MAKIFKKTNKDTIEEEVIVQRTEKVVHSIKDLKRNRKEHKERIKYHQERLEWIDNILKSAGEK